MFLLYLILQTYTYCCAVCDTRSEDPACPNCYFEQVEDVHGLPQAAQTLVVLKRELPQEPDITMRPGPVHGKNMYLVDRIVKRAKVERGGWRYLVQWTGYPESENTWEPRKHVRRTDAFADFMRTEPANAESVSV